jgi:antitoxin component of MazEF toxin-antitoxin module
MVKKLTRTGNSVAVVLDKAILARVGLAPGSPVDVSTDGEVIVIAPHRKGKRAVRIADARYASVFKRLAE